MKQQCVCVEALTEAQNNNKTPEVRPFTLLDDCYCKCKLFCRRFTNMDLKNSICDYEVRVTFILRPLPLNEAQV